MLLNKNKMTEIVKNYNFSNLSKLIGKSKKARQLVDEAEKLFLRYGLEKVSVEEICQAAKVSKMTFYRYFQNKIHLFLFIINRIMDQAEKKYYQIMGQEVSYQEKARQIVQMKIKISQDFSYQMLQDYLNSPHPEIRNFIHQKTQNFFHLFLQDLQKAQKRGEIRENIKPEFILFILNRLADFVADEDLLQLYSSPKELTEEWINFFFFGILCPNPVNSSRDQLKSKAPEASPNPRLSQPKNKTSLGRNRKQINLPKQ